MSLKRGDVVQLSPDFHNEHFRGAFVMVTEPKIFGMQGYVHGLDRGEAYIRAEWNDIEWVGRATWVPQGEWHGDEQD